MKWHFPFSGWFAIALFLVCGAILTICGIRLYIESPHRGLPYLYSFLSGQVDDWTAYGGNWEVANGAMMNESDERGAKLVTGSQYWRDYVFDADVQLLGENGDAGIIFRVTKEEDGVDAYHGYYLGLRAVEARLSNDNSLVLGRSDDIYTEFGTAPIPGGVVPLRWYHLRALVYGCDIAVSATSLNTPAQPVAFSVTDPDCEPAGRIGFRSYAGGGIWRNVEVHRAKAVDFAAMMNVVRSSKTEIQHNTRGVHFSSEPTLPAQPSASGTPDAVPIENLRMIPTVGPLTFSIKGTVIATGPLLYVQDYSGGAQVVRTQTSSTLRIGDEVQATGRVEPGDFSPILRDATVRLLWAGAPLPPVSVTPSQAATGAFDATFIEVKGYLRSKHITRDNSLVLNLDGGEQEFQAIMMGGRAALFYATLRTGSLLTLRGVCTVDQHYTQGLTPFSLLLRSTDDVGVIAGPPWWSVEHLVFLTVSFLLLAMIVQLFYLRIERWRLHAVLEERERLAHEMHDTLAQSFAGIGYQLQAISNGIQDENRVVHEQVDLACDLVRHSHEEARRSIATLRPESIESRDLLSALEECARKMIRGGSLEVTSSCTGEPRSMPLRITDTLFRIGQEAIANSVRHAEPTHLIIALSYSASATQLIIEDDGIGFVNRSSLLGFGLRGMRKRADSIAAELRIESIPLHGTRIELTAPLPPRVTLWNWPKHLWNTL